MADKYLNDTGLAYYHSRIKNKLTPDVTTNDNGKVLKVSNGAWTVANETPELPSVTSSDSGKVLRVSSTGTWEEGSIPLIGYDDSMGEVSTSNISANNGLGVVAPLYIDDSSAMPNVICHADTPVTPGTYVASYDSAMTPTYYFPSITVDDYGHVTSASNYGASIPVYNGEVSYNANPGVISSQVYNHVFYGSFDTKIQHKYGGYYGRPLSIAAGSTSATTTMSVSGTTFTGVPNTDCNNLVGYNANTTVTIRVTGVDAWLDNGTENIPTIVDWVADRNYGVGSATGPTVTVSVEDPVPTGSTLYYYINYDVIYFTM